ncbi:aminoacylase-1 isoform X1 [Dendroctonus ponderosae]|uniref:aminoacylase-1 isoform X1 n=1 Tax=Dendroctonus ponderosae TaxID=77166 RepID=UPI0020358C36|nr:aminoacylase-1 isoform X1 [Dendroctonus ponderosae]XP_048518893.1 aminoacylase-1 isoform X1 [Dendroctonus ponderosae]XP_048518894.1 aminoacylase-1 isoform X1 [Dendroctonus ponderosae]XP_048518895.1 aminoacylase-1 isoform X1 [Dendroctonus ponderosae]
MSPLTAEQAATLDSLAVENFRKYLQIPSVHPHVDYEPCVQFLRAQAKGLDLPLKVYTVVEGKPIVVITWSGSEPALPSILLNSHMDVVPVFADKWAHPPFSAHTDAQGNIYARGAQDMKCVGIQYLEAIRRMRLAGATVRRTVHVAFMPDEEIGGVDGMRQFVHTEDFKGLNVGFALDEGMASPDDAFPVFYGERNIWHLVIHFPGTPGHGSLLLKDTAGEKVALFLNTLFEFRRSQVLKLAGDPTLTLGDVTTVNLTQLKGGVQSNVVPPELVATVDCRLPVTVDDAAFEAQVKKWLQEAGSDIWVEWEQKEPQVTPTKLDASNPYWLAFKRTMDELGLQVRPQIFPGGTDCRFVRSVGVPALGFSPMKNTPILLHDHDEYLNRAVFLEGVRIYARLIPAVANLRELTG